VFIASDEINVHSSKLGFQPHLVCQSLNSHGAKTSTMAQFPGGLSVFYQRLPFPFNDGFIWAWNLCDHWIGVSESRHILQLAEGEHVQCFEHTIDLYAYNTSYERRDFFTSLHIVGRGCACGVVSSLVPW